MPRLSQPHLLGIKNITRDDIELIFDTADNFKEVINRPIKRVPSLRDVTIANVFLKTLPGPDSHSNWPRKDFLPMSLTFPLPPVL